MTKNEAKARQTCHLFEQLSQSLELGLELSVVVLEYLHARLKPALVLAQQLRLGNHITVGLAPVRAVLGRRARGLLQAQLLVLGLQGCVLLLQLADHRLKLLPLLGVDLRHHLDGATGHVDPVAAVEALAVVRYELVLVVAVRGGVAASARQLDFSQTGRVNLESRVHVLAEGAVLGRRGWALEGVTFQYRLHREVADPGVLFEVALRLELVPESSSEVPNVFARRRLLEKKKISIIQLNIKKCALE